MNRWERALTRGFARVVEADRMALYDGGRHVGSVWSPVTKRGPVRAVCACLRWSSDARFADDAVAALARHRAVDHGEGR